jgi:hypothetical protein
MFAQEISILAQNPSFPLPPSALVNAHKHKSPGCTLVPSAHNIHIDILLEYTKRKAFHFGTAYYFKPNKIHTTTTTTITLPPRGLEQNMMKYSTVHFTFG